MQNMLDVQIHATTVAAISLALAVSVTIVVKLVFNFRDGKKKKSAKPLSKRRKRQ